MEATTIKLKLLIDTRAKKVILAEAGKDFIDYLIYLLSLPLVTVARHLKGENMVGSLGYLYQSIENIPDTCLLQHPSQTIPLMQSDYDLKNRMAYGCNEHFYVADVPNMPRPTCRQKMTYSVSYVPTFTPSAGLRPVDVGFVKDSSSVKYIVLDNLEFMPMSSEYFFTLLKKFKINEKDGDALEEIAVDFGMEEGLKLLKLSLECNTVLTSFYRGKV